RYFFSYCSLLLRLSVNIKSSKIFFSRLALYLPSADLYWSAPKISVSIAPRCANRTENDNTKARITMNLFIPVGFFTEDRPFAARLVYSITIKTFVQPQI